MARRPDHNPKSKKSGDSRHGGQQRRQHRTITSVSSGQLPKWVRDEITRSTPKDRREPAFSHLSKGMEAFADERYPAALRRSSH